MLVIAYSLILGSLYKIRPKRLANLLIPLGHHHLILHLLSKVEERQDRKLFYQPGLLLQSQIAPAFTSIRPLLPMFLSNFQILP